MRNFAEVKERQELIRKYKEELKRINNRAEISIFELLNTKESLDEEIDLHGQHKNEALTITKNILQETKEKLNEGRIEPNMKDEINHVFKIICGRGKGSIGGVAVLKNAIPKMLKDDGYDFHADDFDAHHGVFLVRFQKQ